MENMENMEEVDLEVPPPLPPPAPSPPSPRKLAKAASGRMLATPARALSLVVLVVGLLFAIHLLMHDLRTFTLLVGEFLCIFLVMSCAAACEAGARDGACPSRGSVAVVELAVWSFAMALTVTMTFWVASSLPLPVVVVLYLLSLFVLSACFAVLLGG